MPSDCEPARDPLPKHLFTFVAAYCRSHANACHKSYRCSVDGLRRSPGAIGFLNIEAEAVSCSQQQWLHTAVAFKCTYNWLLTVHHLYIYILHLCFEAAPSALLHLCFPVVLSTVLCSIFYTRCISTSAFPLYRFVIMSWRDEHANGQRATVCHFQKAEQSKKLAFELQCIWFSTRLSSDSAILKVYVLPFGSLF